MYTFLLVIVYMFRVRDSETFLSRFNEQRKYKKLSENVIELWVQEGAVPEREIIDRTTKIATAIDFRGGPFLEKGKTILNINDKGYVVEGWHQSAPYVMELKVCPHY